MADDATRDDDGSRSTSEAGMPPDPPSKSESEQEEDVLGAAPTEPAAKKRLLRLRGGGDGSRKPLRLPRRRALLILVVILVPILAVTLGPVVAGAIKKTPRDKFGLSYTGGPAGAHFQRMVQPGSGLFFNGWFADLYLYPADQRTYIVTKVKGQGSTRRSDSIIAPARDRVPVEYQVAVYFKLDSDRLREFHEQLGLKYKAYTSDGWDRLIQDTFRQQIESSLQAETRRYDVADLYANADLLAQIQSEVQRSLKERLVNALGDDYFCGPTFKPRGKCSPPRFVIKAIDLPKDVVKAFQDNRTSEVQILTKQNEIQQRLAESQAIAALNISGQDYVLLKGIESGQIKFWVVPSNNGLTVQAPSGAGPQP